MTLSSKAKKILCTLGPASLNERTIRRLGELGVSLFRLNLSHMRVSELEATVRFIRSQSPVPICLDTQGAQARTGQLSKEKIWLETHSIVELGKDIPLYPPSVLPSLAIGDLVSIDFHAALLQVVEIHPSCRARVLNGGWIGSNKAVSFDRPLSLPPFTETDLEAIEIGKRLGIRHIALSFASRADDIIRLRELAGEGVEIIAKIESRSGLENLEEILRVADSILIDRGDLSREIPLERIPLAQKKVLREANRAGVPVFVATNLLESMVAEPRPSRAEVNDVINTLLDGADGLVLAAETAIGKYPVECVSMIRSLISEFESSSGSFQVSSPGRGSSIVTSPHGGQLVMQIFGEGEKEILRDLPRLEVGRNTWMDVRLIATGVFSPLTGFMGHEELESVLERNRLPSGEMWPLPILLPISDETAKRLAAYEAIALTLEGKVRARLEIREIFTCDLGRLAQRWFGTVDRRHPGVAGLLTGSGRFIAGSVGLLEGDGAERSVYQMTPRQTRFLFEHCRWQKVAGFQARVNDSGGYAGLLQTLVDEYHCDGLLMHPVSGPSETDADIMSLMRHKAHQGRLLVTSLPSYQRFSGPREALLAAICHKNYGCSHFVMGGEHRAFLDSVGPLGIDAIFLDGGCSSPASWERA